MLGVRLKYVRGLSRPARADAQPQGVLKGGALKGFMNQKYDLLILSPGFLDPPNSATTTKTSTTMSPSLRKSLAPNYQRQFSIPIFLLVLQLRKPLAKYLFIASHHLSYSEVRIQAMQKILGAFHDAMGRPHA